ncbi:MAG: DNA primase [Planctomycetaceae bacterium]
MADLSNDFRETVRTRTDLVSLIGESVALKPVRGGREFVALCPFHDDHNPSMHVYPDRQTFRCWVCDTGGDCFTFVMEEAKIGFRDALELLAKRAGLEMPKEVGKLPAKGESADDRAQLMEALLWAQHEFHQALLKSPAGQRARDYLAQRGLTAETIERFKLGYHPDDWQWLLGRARGKFTPQQLEAARLAGRRDGDGGYFDNFTGRLLFPIWNERGQPVSFGGRILPGDDDSHGKYWNGPESSVFHKSRLVYALHTARDGIRDAKSVIVTEGYTDCIALHQAGIRNAVATLGTALTEQHVTLLKRFVRQVVLVYDGDEAGQNAAERAVEKFLAQDVDLRILSLPGKLDPAEFITTHGVEAFQQLSANAAEAWEYKYRATAQRFGVNTLDGRQRALDEMLALLAVVPRMSGHVREAMLLGNLSQRLQVPEQQVRERYRAVRGEAARGKTFVHRGHDNASSPSRDPHVEIARLYTSRATTSDRGELPILEAVVLKPELLSYLQGDPPLEAFQNRALRRIAQIGIEVAARGSERATHIDDANLTFNHWLDAIEHPDLKRLFVQIDEQARLKNVNVHLQDPKADDGCPLYLRRLLENLHMRREEQSQQEVAASLAATRDGPQGLDAATVEALRQAAEFQQRRATRKAPV